MPFALLSLVFCTSTNFNHLFKVKFQGLTGEVQFNPQSGERRVHNGLDLLNIKEFVEQRNQQHVKQVRVQKVRLLGSLVDTLPLPMADDNLQHKLPAQEGLIFVIVTLFVA